MVTETTNPAALAPLLLPDRHPQHDLFICDVADAVLKDVLQHMEHPFYALSKRPETAVRRYEHNGNWLEITPSVKGLATIYDKDILIYCISQIMAKLKRGEKVSQRVRISSRDLLIFTNRGTSGRDYQALIDALDRLEGTRIRTNIVTGEDEQIDGFGLIDASSIRRKHGLDGRLLWCEVKLSDWVFNAIRAREVLTLHRGYFRLRKPIERRVYELARKHCGRQKRWRVSLALLRMKAGAQSPLKRFRQMIRHLAEHDHLPDYRVELDPDEVAVVFINRGLLPLKQKRWRGALDPECYDDARSAAPGWDVQWLEERWRTWLAENDVTPRHPGRHFVSWCRTWQGNHGAPR
jgi:plasmid replication initiation protein